MSPCDPFGIRSYPFVSVRTNGSERTTQRVLRQSQRVLRQSLNIIAVEDSARIVHAFWALATGLGLVAYFEYVKSSANIADAPSRGEYDALHELGSSERQCLIPPAAAWVSTKEALDFGLLRSAQASPLARVSKRAHADE
jgi:hypothetical protein